MAWRGESGPRGRATAAGLTLCIHGLALLAAFAASHAVPGGAPGERQRLTVFTTPAAPRPPMERHPPRDVGKPALASLPPKPAAAIPLAPPSDSGSALAAPLRDAPRSGPVAQTAPSPTPDAPPPLPAPSAAAADDAFAAYRQAVWAKVHAQRPRGGGQVAVATVRFRLDGAGALLAADLARSSGDALLDRLALRAVRAASPFPPAPAGVGADRLVFTLPIRFR